MFSCVVIFSVVFIYGILPPARSIFTHTHTHTLSLSLSLSLSISLTHSRTHARTHTRAHPHIDRGAREGAADEGGCAAGVSCSCLSPLWCRHAAGLSLHSHESALSLARPSDCRARLLALARPVSRPLTCSHAWLAVVLALSLNLCVSRARTMHAHQAHTHIFARVPSAADSNVAVLRRCSRN